MAQSRKLSKWMAFAILTLTQIGCSTMKYNITTTNRCGEGLVTSEVRHVGGVELRLMAPRRVCVFESEPLVMDYFSGDYSDYLKTKNRQVDITLMAKNTTSLPITIVRSAYPSLIADYVWEEYSSGLKSEREGFSGIMMTPEHRKSASIDIAPGETVSLAKDIRYLIVASDVVDAANSSNKPIKNPESPRTFGVELIFSTAFKQGNQTKRIEEKFEAKVEFLYVSVSSLKEKGK